MFKPPKMFHLKSNSETVPPPPAQPVPEPENQRVWSPSATSDATSSPISAVPPQVAEPILSSTPTEDLPKEKNIFKSYRR